ncbi:MAG: sulfatase-like hydrolase/transferase, partial [Bdellovibrionales bacterium]
MNSRRRLLLIVLLIGFNLAVYYYLVKWFLRHRAGEIPKVPAVLVVSTCSLQTRLLKQYGLEGEIVLPNLERFFKDSTYVFQNAFNPTPWTNLQDFIPAAIRGKELVELGYRPLNIWPADFFTTRIPLRRSVIKPEEKFFINSLFEKQYRYYYDLTREMITYPDPRPFFIAAHLKYMHFPLIDVFNPDSEWDFYLNADERELVREYTTQPERYPEKLPLLMMLTQNPNIALTHPKVKKWIPRPSPADRVKVSGLVTNAELLKDWESSPSFKQDLELFKKVYRGNARYLDRLLGPMLNLYGNKNLQRNTIVVFVGDHGEAHMDHGLLTHGQSVYDQELRVPMAIRIPGRVGERIVVNESIHHGVVARLLGRILRRTAHLDDLKKDLKELHDDYVIARDCANTVRGLRYQNKYKYFVRVADGERFLFDLEKDPEERRNLAAARPDLIEEFEARYW